MTTQTQTFISLDEIIGLRCECHGCHSKYSIPFTASSNLFRPQEGTDYYRCPHCGEEWFEGNNDTRLIALKSVVKSLTDICLRNENMAFDLMFEVKREAFSREASDRA